MKQRKSSALRAETTEGFLFLTNLNVVCFSFRLLIDSPTDLYSSTGWFEYNHFLDHGEINTSVLHRHHTEFCSLLLTQQHLFLLSRSVLCLFAVKSDFTWTKFVIKCLKRIPLSISPPENRWVSVSRSGFSLQHHMKLHPPALWAARGLGEGGRRGTRHTEQTNPRQFSFFFGPASIKLNVLLNISTNKSHSDTSQSVIYNRSDNNSEAQSCSSNYTHTSTVITAQSH